MGLHGLGLFEGITEQELRQMQRCFEAYFQSYQAGERIRRYGEGNVVGVLASGIAAVCRIDADGSKTVLEYLRENGVFGEMLAFSSAEDLELICIKPCRVMFIDYRHIVRRCEKACVHHSRLVANMLRLLSEKSRALSERVEILSQRSTRSKLLAYFRLMARKSGGRAFLLPFSLRDLAEYIAADRSAMMRELKRMKEEGLISVAGREVTVY